VRETERGIGKERERGIDKKKIQRGKVRER
jgi:hypothetical protein